MSSLEDIIRSAFDDVKRAYYQPPIKGPEISEAQKTAFLNWLKLNVGINPSFVKKLSEQLDGSESENLRTISEGLITHEFGHYFFHPRTMKMHLLLSYNLSNEERFKGYEDAIFGTFTDFENDALVVFEDFMKESLKKTREASYNSNKDAGPANAALNLAYKNKLGLDINVDLNEFDNETQKEILKAVEELDKTIITSKENYNLQWTQLYNWGHALLPLLKKSNKNSGTGDGNHQALTPEDIQNLPNELKNEVEQALNDLIKDLPKKTYDEIKKHFLGKEASSSQKGTGIGSGSNNEQSAVKDTIDYYINAARAFGYYVKPKRQNTISAVKVPFGKKDWKPTDPMNGVDVTFSGGKLIPGITKSIKHDEIPYPSIKDIVPRLLIYKDSSGSMPDPRSCKDYATIAGSIITLSYLKSGSEVGIATFDSETSGLFISRNANDLIGKLCSYKGGGTTFDIERLKKDAESRMNELPLDARLDMESMKHNPLFRKYINKNAKVNFNNLKKTATDVYIITDGGISNLDEVVGFLKSNPEYRPTIIHTSGFDLKINGYDQKTSGVYEGITVLKAETSEDIINLTRKAVLNNLIRGK